jgi:hypothetical protein
MAGGIRINRIAANAHASVLGMDRSGIHSRSEEDANWNPCRNADKYQPHSRRENLAEHVLPCDAQRHADADLVRVAGYVAYVDSNPGIKGLLPPFEPRHTTHSTILSFRE